MLNSPATLVVTPASLSETTTLVWGPTFVTAGQQATYLIEARDTARTSVRPLPFLRFLDLIDCVLERAKQSAAARNESEPRLISQGPHNLPCPHAQSRFPA